MDGEDDNQVVATTLQAMASSTAHHDDFPHYELSPENRDIVQLIEKEDLPNMSDEEGDHSPSQPVAEKPKATSEVVVVVVVTGTATKTPGKKRGPYKKKPKKVNIAQEGTGTPAKSPGRKRGPYKKKRKKGDIGIELFEDDEDEDDDELISKEDGLMFPMALYADYMKQAEQIKILKQTVAQLTATTQYWKAKAANPLELDEEQPPLPAEPPIVIDLASVSAAKALVSKETAALLTIASKNPPVKNRKQLQSELEQIYDYEKAKEAVKKGDFFYFAKQPDALYGRFGARFKKGYCDLIQYKGERGNCNVPKSFEDTELSRFVKFMRREFSKYARIQEEAEASGGPAYSPAGFKLATSHNQPRIDAMNCIGFQWKISGSFLEDQWEVNRRSILEHYKIHKTFRVNKRLDSALHKWADNQRRGKKLMERVGEERAKGFTWARKAKLDEIGFPWTSAEDPMPEETFRKFISGNPLIFK
jgi:hypothetical protein